MSPHLESSARLILQYLLIVMLAATAWKVAGRLIGNARGPRLLIAGLVFFSSNVVLIAVPGLIGWLTAKVVLAFATAFMLAANVWCSSAPAPLDASAAPVEEPAARDAFERFLLRRPHWLIAPFILLTVPHLLRVLLLVPVDWDGLCYHLFLPVHWIQQQRIAAYDMPPPYTAFSFYPKNYECTLTLSMIVASGDLMAKWFTWPCIGLCGLATALICRELGGHRLACWASAAMVLTTINLVGMAATVKPDPMVIFAMLSALWLLLRVIRQQGAPRTSSFLCGLACGLAAGGKYTALLPVLIIACVVPVAAPRGKRFSRDALQSTALFAIGAVVTGAWCYAWNYHVTGNPFYPAPLGPFKGMDDSIFSLRLLNHLIDLPYLVTIWDGTAKVLMTPPGTARLTYGAKFYLALALLAFAIISGARHASRLSRAGERQDALAWRLTIACLLAVVYVYFSVPYFRGEYIPSLVRISLPALMLASACSFALLSRRRVPAPWFWLLPVAGTLLDALWIDLRVPELSSAAWVPAAFAAGVAVCWRFRNQTRVVWGTIFTLGLLLPALHADREARRYTDFETWSEGHEGGFQRFATAAAWLQTQPEDASVAVAFGNDFEFLYLYSAPDLARRVHYIPTTWEVQPSWKTHGHMRDLFDRAAWHHHIAHTRDRFLILHKWTGQHWPPERQWAQDFHLRLAFAADAVEIYELPASGA